MKRISLISPLLIFLLLALPACGLFIAFHAKESWAQPPRLTSQEIKKEARNYLLKHLSWGPERMSIKIQYEGSDVSIPSPNYVLDFKLPGSKNRIGRFPFILQIKLDTGRPITISLLAQVEVTYDVLQTSRPVKRGEVLEEGDLEWDRIKSTRILRQVVTELDDAVGHRIMRNLDQGEQLSPYMLKSVPLIKQGDQVILLAQKGSLTVRVPGLAKQNGFKNNSVMVKNIQSGKVVVGKVINSRTVKVDF